MIASQILNMKTIRLLIGLISMAATPLFANGIEQLKRDVVAQYAKQAHANYEDAWNAAKSLRAAVAEFLRQPSDNSMKAAKQAWLDSRVPYLQTEVCRFYDGPIEKVEIMINAWPMDEYFIDYVEGVPTAGIIQSFKQFPRITEEVIIGMNESEGEKCVTLGFHAIEFLLWGQDFSANGPGNRPVTDYIGQDAESQFTADRRKEYLRICSELLVKHLGQVVEDWSPEKKGNYREEFLALPAEKSLALILRGYGSLAGPELSGERLTVAYETHLQEDEHSCFSDNTHNDFRYDSIGLQNVFLGRYKRSNGEIIKGPGVFDLLLKVDEKLALKVSGQVAEAVTAAREIPQPFDQAILAKAGTPERKALKRAIDAFHELSRGIAEAGHEMGLKLRF